MNLNVTVHPQKINIVRNVQWKVTTPEMIDKIHDMVLSDRRIKVCEIIVATGISQGTVFSILYEKLGVKKKSLAEATVLAKNFFVHC